MRCAFKLADPPGQGQPQQERRRELAAIVVVELQFWQQIAQRNTQKGSRRKGQGVGQSRSTISFAHQAKAKNQNPQGNRQREQAINHMPPGERPATVSHQRGNRHRIKRLVQHDNQECAEPGKSHRLMPVGDAGRQGNSFDHTMERESQGRAAPGKTVAVIVCVVAFGAVMAGDFAIIDFMMVKTKKTFDKKHRQQAHQNPQHDLHVGSCGGHKGVGRLIERMRQHVQESNPQHHPRHKAHRTFHPAVRQPHQHRNHAASDGHQQNQQAIIREQYIRIHAMKYGTGTSLRQARPTCRRLRMRACIQRVSRARVVVDSETVGEIGRGLLVLLGIAGTDTAAELIWLADKIVGLRIFEDDAGKMNCSLSEVEGQILVVSQFTLYGDCRKGRRPSFTSAAAPEMAEAMYEKFVTHLVEQGISTATGRFRKHMDVELINDGPVTIWIDTNES